MQKLTFLLFYRSLLSDQFGIFRLYLPQEIWLKLEFIKPKKKNLIEIIIIKKKELFWGKGLIFRFVARFIFDRFVSDLWAHSHTHRTFWGAIKNTHQMYFVFLWHLLCNHSSFSLFPASSCHPTGRLHRRTLLHNIAHISRQQKTHEPGISCRQNNASSYSKNSKLYHQAKSPLFKTIKHPPIRHKTSLRHRAAEQTRRPEIF